MSQFDDTTTKAGTITTEEGKGGKLKFYAFNHTRGKRLHIGTLIGQTYEKVAVILRQPEPSLTSNTQEIQAVQDAGGYYLRFIVNNSQTYSISVTDFLRHAEKYYNPSYGYQLRVALKHFEFMPAVAKRNARTDNPVIGRDAPIIRDRQMSFLG